MFSRKVRAVLVLVLAAALFWVGHELRGQWGGLSVESLRKWVDGAGWTAPVLYLAVLAVRPFLLLPTFIVLPAGGACFGLAAGTLLGAVGVTLSALLQFALARGFGRETVRRRFGESLGKVRQRIETAGPLVVAFVTAHPTGPMTAFHWGAGLASVSLVSFTAAVAVGAMTRAFLYSFFGASLAEPDSPLLYLAAALLLAFFLLPVVHRGFRERLFGRLPAGSYPPPVE